jgi:predicted PurR-regulated permease PerM
VVESEKVSKYIFIIILLILSYLAFTLAQPFLTYIFLGAILTIAVYPFYCWFCTRIKNRKLGSIIAIVLILLIVIIPSFIIISALAKQTIGFINSFDQSYFEKINGYVVNVLGPKVDLMEHFNEFIVEIKNIAVKSAVSIASSIADIGIGLFVMFFIMYYGFVEGAGWLMNLKEFIPFNKERKEKLVRRIKDVTQGVLYGQIFVALLQGAFGGLGFFFVGISNPVFWGFIMAILAFIPVVGTGLVWVPAGIIEIINHNVLGGIFIFVFGFIMIAGIDNFLKPKIISGKANIHPIVAMIGVLGGLKAFGLFGIIIGPVIAALFITMAEFFYEDYVKNR